MMNRKKEGFEGLPNTVKKIYRLTLNIDVFKRLLLIEKASK
jgi:hypothetical protein